jgi:hypothetical protein
MSTLMKFIKIDRSKPFDPSPFIGEGGSIIEQDQQSLALNEIDLTEVKMRTVLHQGESTIVGEESLGRQKELGDIRLDANIFKTLWENQHLIPEKWKEERRGSSIRIFFDGFVVQDWNAKRYALCLFWDVGQWWVDSRELKFDRYPGDVSAVLPKKSQ